MSTTYGKYPRVSYEIRTIYWYVCIYCVYVSVVFSKVYALGSPGTEPVVVVSLYSGTCIRVPSENMGVPCLPVYPQRIWKYHTRVPSENKGVPYYSKRAHDGFPRFVSSCVPLSWSFSCEQTAVVRPPTKNWLFSRRLLTYTRLKKKSALFILQMLLNFSANLVCKSVLVVLVP